MLTALFPAQPLMLQHNSLITCCLESLPHTQKQDSKNNLCASPVKWVAKICISAPSNPEIMSNYCIKLTCVLGLGLVIEVPRCMFHACSAVYSGDHRGHTGVSDFHHKRQLDHLPGWNHWRLFKDFGSGQLFGRHVSQLTETGGRQCPVTAAEDWIFWNYSNSSDIAVWKLAGNSRNF